MHPRSRIIALLGLLLAVSSAIAQQLIATVPVGGVFSWTLAVDPVTDKIYVNIANNDLMTVIDGATLATTNVTVGGYTSAIAVNPVTNKIYSSNSQDQNNLTIVDGLSLSTTGVTVDRYPDNIAVDSIRNKIYVSTEYSVAVIDGTTNHITTVPVHFGGSLDLNTVTNKIYVATDDGVLVIDGATLATTLAPATATIVAVDPTTNKVYGVYNSIFGTSMMNIIDGATLSVTTITIGQGPPTAMAVNPVTSKIYVADSDNTVAVVDGATLSILTVPVGQGPAAMAVDSITNKIYVANQTDNSVTVIDGNTNSTVSLQVGNYPAHIAANPTTNRIYVSNFQSGTVSVIAGAPSSTPPLGLIPITPCRLVDTRQTGNPIQGGTSQSFTVPQLGGCSIPNSAVAYSLNVTVAPHGPLGYLTIWSTGQSQPLVSTLNSPDGRTKANAAIVPAGASGAVSVYVTDTTDVILDIDGYFTAPGSGTLQFFPLTPCRLVDTRGADGQLGGPRLPAQMERNFPLLMSSCIPSGVTPAAYSLNFTAVPNPPHQHLGYLTVWPAGEPQPTVSTLNNPTGTDVANAAIVPAGAGGEVAVYAYNTTDLLIDINGYFAAPGTGGYSFYPAAPCRVIDTRSNNGQPFSGTLSPPVNVVGSPCAPPSTATAYVFNATAVPNRRLGYMTLWPDGETQPVVSTLNAYDGFVTSNMAIVPNMDGMTDAYAGDGSTQLILDISGYFAP
jgi:YVTN family beta-propeller protein